MRGEESHVCRSHRIIRDAHDSDLYQKVLPGVHHLITEVIQNDHLVTWRRDPSWGRSRMRVPGRTLLPIVWTKDTIPQAQLQPKTEGMGSSIHSFMFSTNTEYLVCARPSSEPWVHRSKQTQLFLFYEAYAAQKKNFFSKVYQQT